MLAAEASLGAVDECLARLQPHLEPRATALTGGVAIHLHLIRAGRSSRRRGFADVDLVANNWAAVRPSVSREFLISHYHLPHPGYTKFLVQLADPGTRLRVDVFGDLTDLLADTHPVLIGQVSTAVLSPRRLLEAKVRLVTTATVERPVDPKHYQDAVDLAEFLGVPRPVVGMQVLMPDHYRTDRTMPCARCEASRRVAYPLAPKERILATLGYV
jgi:hypothetical protein